MGTSHPETKPWIMEKAKRARVKTVLDVGAGSGTYRDYFYNKGFNPTMDAVEIWQPYIDTFSLKDKYNKVYKEDIREFTKYHHDLVIFGDVLEHMTQEEAFDVWKKASRKCKYGVISIPIINYHQHAINGNPYEEHVKEDWSHKEVLSTFPGIQDHWLGNITGAYWARFDV